MDLLSAPAGARGGIAARASPLTCFKDYVLGDSYFPTPFLLTAAKETVRFRLTASSFLCAQKGTKSQGLAPLGTYSPKTISFVCADVMLRIGRMAGLLSLRLLSQTKLLCNFVCKIRSAPSAPMRLSFALRKETVFEIQRKALTGPSVPSSIDRHAKSGHSLHLFPLPLMRTSTEVPAAHGRAPGAETCWQQARSVGLARYHDRQEAAAGNRGFECRLTQRRKENTAPPYPALP